ncbi:MAG: DUF2127 domain-containing protein, partial [Methylophilaceae bacterium]
GICADEKSTGPLLSVAVFEALAPESGQGQPDDFPEAGPRPGERPSLVFFIEAHGLWHGKRWAEWFTALSGAMYLPFELREIVSSHSGLAVAALLINGLVVALMVHELRRPKTSSR